LTICGPATLTRGIFKNLTICGPATLTRGTTYC
jgi:sulfur relay (sulfurtransferase) complex TusBCD TusD component (DsrE family)